MKNIDGLNRLVENAFNNKVFLSGSYGLCINKEMNTSYFGSSNDLTDFKEVDSNNLFDCASLSKVISTTTLILLLQEKGLLRLYDKVSYYLTDFKHKNITIYDLITHTSGLPSDVYSVSNIKDKAEVLLLIYNMNLTYSAGEKIVYSDIGFILLGFIIEKIMEKPLNIVAKEWIFDVLKMPKTTYNPLNKEVCIPTELRDDKLYKGRVKGFVHDETAYLLGGIAGHAGLFSTCDDILNYLQMILHNGMFENKKFLSKQSIDLLFKTCVEECAGTSKNTNKRSIGYIVKGDYPSCGELVSENTIYHTGYTGCNLFIDRENKIGFVLLTNRVYYGRNNLELINLRPKLANYIVAQILES